MYYFRRIIKATLLFYIFYVFIFAFLFPLFQKNIGKDLEVEELNKVLDSNRKNDRAALIESAEDAAKIRLDLIDGANSSIDISYYKFTSGEYPEIFSASLIQAADRGVKIRILLDGLLQANSFLSKVDANFLAFESHPNIELKLYEPFNPIIPLAWNNRLHDKIILVDNEFVLLGGRNIEDRFYLEEASGDSFTKDRDILIYNPNSRTKTNSVLAEIETYYNKLWNYKHSKKRFSSKVKRGLNLGNNNINILRDDYKSKRKVFLNKHFHGHEEISWKEKTRPTEGIRFISNEFSRYSRQPKCLKAIFQLTSEAEIDMFVQSPYIIPSRNIRKTLDQYEISLDEVNFLTNSLASSPNLAGLAGYATYRKEMIDLGLKVFEYQGPGSIHAKSASFDRDKSLIGSFNLDPRSSYLSTESIVIVEGEEFNSYFKEEIGKNLYYSLEVDGNYRYIDTDKLPAYETSSIKSLIVKFLSIFSPFFEHLL